METFNSGDQAIAMSVQIITQAREKTPDYTLLLNNIEIYITMAINTKVMQEINTILDYNRLTFEIFWHFWAVLREKEKFNLKNLNQKLKEHFFSIKKLYFDTIINFNKEQRKKFKIDELSDKVFDVTFKPLNTEALNKKIKEGFK